MAELVDAAGLRSVILKECGGSTPPLSIKFLKINFKIDF